MSSRPRAPWWIYVIGIMLVATFAFDQWVEFMGPGGSGFGWDGLKPRITQITPGSPIERAGARVNDWIISANGRAIDSNLDWIVAGMTFEIGKPIPVVVVRNGQRVPLQMTIRDRRYRSLDAASFLGILAMRLAQLICLSLALLMLFSKPSEITSWLAAWLLASIGVVNLSPFRGGAVLLAQLPWPVAIFLALPTLLANVAPTAWTCFFLSFPRRLLTKPWHWAVAMLSGTPILMHLLWQIYWMLLPGRAIPFFSVRSFFIVGGLASSQELVGLGVLVWNYARARDVNEKRRLRVIMAGMLIGWPAALTAVLAQSTFSQTAGSILFLVFPFSFAYAILKQRLFDVLLIIRQGLQYALARRVILSVIPAAVVLLLVDILTRFTLVGAQIAGGRSVLLADFLISLWPDGVAAALIVLVYTQHAVWLEKLDKRFFRERYDGNRILREVVENLRRAGDFESALPEVVASIDSALHPEFAAVLAREPGQAAYRPVAACPSSASVNPLPAESKVAGLLRLLEKPLELTGNDSNWTRELPTHESGMLRDSRIDLLVPVVVGAEKREAVLALGPRRSGEPYSREDKDLLSSIAGSLSLLLERPAAMPARAAYGECSDCGTCYDSGATRCGSDGLPLTPMPFPRMLASRYRLEKRLGRGGMGTVYRASDTALEREVAVKMLREDLIANAEAAERFRREARMSAAVTHPNLVAIHDFGIESGRGAFLVMELLIGKNLRQQLLQAGRMPALRALEVLRGVCAAVEAAHKRGLIHRDLKPENIFLAAAEATEVPKVLDFGVAKLVAQAPNSALPTADTGDGVLLGTAQYMCPEQLRGELVEPAWDIWALAVIAYEVLTGTHPFLAPTIAGVHAAVLEGRYKPVRETLGDAAPAVEDFFRSALAAERSRRPASAGELLSRLERSVSASRSAGA